MRASEGRPVDCADPQSQDTDRGWIWPTAIVAGLLLVVIVNVGFIILAVGGADEVVESYTTEAR